MGPAVRWPRRPGRGEKGAAAPPAKTEGPINPATVEPTGMISIVAVTHNSAAWLPDLCRSLRAQEVAGPVERIYVDNGSTDGTPEALARLDPEAKVVVQPNLGYGAGCNRGLR